jgi:hypothetical protein
LGPHKNNHCAAKETKSNPSHFAIVGSVILDLKIGSGEDFRRVVEVEASVSKRRLALGWIVVDEHAMAPSFLAIRESLSSPRCLTAHFRAAPERLR